MYIPRAQRQQMRLPDRAVRTKTIPAPVGGINARDSFANMPETDALVLDNWFPQPSWVEVRNGKKLQASFTGNCETVAAYNTGAVEQLYGGVNNAGTCSLYRVDNTGGGPVGAPVVGGAGPVLATITSTQYDWCQFGTGAAEVLYLVNGLDNPLLFDGTTWYSVSAVSSPYALTGGPAPNTLTCVANYHGLLFFTDGSLNVYWLAIDTFAGALTLLPLAAYFQKGGGIVAIITVSIDNALGANDYIAFLSNQGEVVFFYGSNPASTSTWALGGRFRIGRPIAKGRRTWQKMGSDALILCVDGLVLFSQALMTDRDQKVPTQTDKIRFALAAYLQEFGANFGWQVLLYPFGTKIIVNVPTTQDGSSFQFVQNTMGAGAWCTFGRYASSWNAFCFETLGDNLYFGTSGAVYQGDVGGDDAGAAIQALAKPAFSYFDTPGVQKIFQMARPIFTVTGSLSVSIIFNVDFDNTGPTGSIPISTGNGSPWNTSLWTTPTYWGDAQIISKRWLGIAGIGYCGAMQLQTAPLDVGLQWQATDYMFTLGGPV